MCFYILCFLFRINLIQASVSKVGMLCDSYVLLSITSAKLGIFHVICKFFDKKCIFRQKRCYMASSVTVYERLYIAVRIP